MSHRSNLYSLYGRYMCYVRCHHESEPTTLATYLRASTTLLSIKTILEIIANTLILWKKIEICFPKPTHPSSSSLKGGIWQFPDELRLKPEATKNL